jgi:hypothetical protein
MITRMLSAAVGAVATAKAGVWQFASLVVGACFVWGLMKWAGDNPDAFQALATQAGGALMNIATQLLTILERVVTWTANWVTEHVPAAEPTT